jgi:TDG/mug DNA glycosylase family protein
MGAYRHAFGQPKAALGRQPEPFEGATVWVIPSPSGLNANYQLPALVALLRSMRASVLRER